MRVDNPVDFGERNNYGKMLKQVHKALIGNISFGDGVFTDNIAGNWFKLVTPGVVNTEFSIKHGLGKKPVGYDVKRADNIGVVYDGTTPWTDQLIYLRCTVATQNITIFVH